jgi:hypothetical protein
MPSSAGLAPELSVIVLCYKVGAICLRVLEPLHALLVKEGVDFELVPVANYRSGDRDSAPDVVREFARTHDNVHPVSRLKHGAMGWDMRTGLEEARGQYLVVIDGDTQNPYTDALAMYRRMRQSGVAVMKGRRIARHDGAYRRLVSFVLNSVLRLRYRLGSIWDINGKPKGMTRDAYERLGLTSDDWFIDAEIILSARRLGLSVAEMPVVFLRNDERTSLMGVHAMWEYVVHMLERQPRR